MRDRLITGAGALLALLIAYGLFFQRTAQAPITRPISTEGGRNGYLAAATWLEREGARVASFRQRFDRLLDEDAPFAERGNILVTTLPYVNPQRVREVQSLWAWIRRGNTVLIMAALDDTPEWVAGSDTNGFISRLQLMTRLRFSPIRDGGDAGAGSASAPPVGADTPVELEPAGTHPLMQGVERLRGHSDAPSVIWGAAPVDERRLLLRLGVESSSGNDAIWETPDERGRIIIVASGSLLTNRMVAEGDAGRFLANVIDRHLAADGAVIFDDMHQGLSVLYDAAAFFGDRRLHYTIAFLIAAWLVYVLGSSSRLAPPSPPRAAPRPAEFLEAVGGFMARRLDRRDAGLLLLRELFDDVRRTRNPPLGAKPFGAKPFGAKSFGTEPPWDELDATPALDRRSRRRIRRYYERLHGGGSVDLVRLHNLLREARKAIG